MSKIEKCDHCLSPLSEHCPECYCCGYYSDGCISCGHNSIVLKKWFPDVQEIWPGEAKKG